MFCLEFPHDCRFFSGPHSTTCLATLWIDAGCTEDGIGYPERLNSADNATLNAMTIP